VSTSRQSFGRPAGEEMARVLKTAPVRTAPAIDPLQATIDHWRHGALHDVVEPMSDHVLMTYFGTMQRLERRSGRSFVAGTAREGVITIIPAGSSARWDIPGAVDVVQLYLPPLLLDQIAAQAGHSSAMELLERTAHPDAIGAKLLSIATESLDGAVAIDTLFRQQLTCVLATHLLKAHIGVASSQESAVGGLSPSVLRRAMERLQSEYDSDVSLGALAGEAKLSRFHFCRAFKQSTGLAPHEWLRQRRIERAITMLRDKEVSIASIADALGYASQTAFGAAFKRMKGMTPSEWRSAER
jgi:AraC family transcriptional regulator